MSGQCVKDVRAFLLADATVAAITTRIHVNSVPELNDAPYVWLRKARTVYDESTGETPRIYSTWLDVECVALDLSQAETLMEAVHDSLAGQSGTMGASVYAWVEIQDQYDDYIPRNIDADERAQICAEAVEVIHGA